MNGIRRALVVSLGLLVAIAAGLILLPVIAVLDPAAREAGAAFAQFVFLYLARSGLEGSSAFAGAELARFVWTAAIAVCVAPLIITVLIGESARVRSSIWYVGATGVIAAATPWVARAAFRTTRAISATPEELRFAFVFFLTGAVSGLIYWMIAGRPASDRSAAPD
ncbi:conserved membrane hypothetical protein [Methylocella tundrae]|uniref:Uncharacterized protein n=1 Tax=Methylocella tundrae TaxID=227605 RepID=A0A8B6M9U8_METTU|nr:hypothetical protein [Methylocella tundrae]VTZ51710.1 conserved membrane hypothetical protein [Methylocella tundrae]